MAEKMDDREIITFKDLIKVNSNQADALTQLLIQKGIITEREFFITKGGTIGL